MLGLREGASPEDHQQWRALVYFRSKTASPAWRSVARKHTRYLVLLLVSPALVGFVWRVHNGLTAQHIILEHIPRWTLPMSVIYFTAGACAEVTVIALNPDDETSMRACLCTNCTGCLYSHLHAVRSRQNAHATWGLTTKCKWGLVTLILTLPMATARCPHSANYVLPIGLVGRDKNFGG